MDNNTWSFLQELQDPPSFDFAVLILNQPILCDPELVKSLWNQAVVRGLVDGGCNRWFDFSQEHKSNELKLPDFFSGDFDSIKPETKAHFENLKVKMISTPDQDETDFTKALRCIADFLNTNQSNIKMVFAVCESSGRFDQVIGNINTLHLSHKILKDVPVVILSRQNITWVLHPGNHTIYVPKYYADKEYPCGIIPFCGPTVTTTTGFKWNLKNRTMQVGGLVSTSNTFDSETVTISCDRDLVWTTQYCDVDQ